MTDTEKLLEAAGIDSAQFEAAQLEKAFSGAALAAAVKKRLCGEPLQYLLGEWDFYDLTLSVGPGVLIPRPDTETVCDTALALMKSQKSPVVADLCAGSGCIGAVLLAHCYGSTVHAVELSAEALPYLKKNLAPFGDRAAVIEGDVLNPDLLPLPPLDGIVCNPPYLTQAEYGLVQKELLYEPKSALVAEEDGLLFYRVVAEKYKHRLKKDGFLVFEIGYSQNAAVRAILEREGYAEIKSFRDYGGNFRCVSAIKRDSTL